MQQSLEAAELLWHTVPVQPGRAGMPEGRGLLKSASNASYELIKLSCTVNADVAYPHSDASTGASVSMMICWRDKCRQHVCVWQLFNALTTATHTCLYTSVAANNIHSRDRQDSCDLTKNVAANR